MTRRTALAIVCAPFVRIARADNKGKNIIDAVVAALGGQNFLTMHDRVESGRAYSFYREQLSGLSLATIYTRYLERPAPGKLAVRERQAFGKDQDSAVLFNEDGAWEITFRGARPLADERVARYRESTMRNIFYILRVRLNEPGLAFDARGTDIMANQPVEIVDVTDSENRAITLYVNRTTRLPVRQVYYSRDLKTRDRDEEVTHFSKYRDVGNGVMWPFAIERERNGEKIFQIFSDSVTINRDVSDELFTLPSNLKILKKQS